ncbi:MAG: DsbA family protein [Ahrensia sp.]
MLSPIKTLAATALLASTMVPLANAWAFDAAQKDEIGTIVREYLLENPEILVEMQTVLEERQRVAEAEARTQILSEASDRIFNNAKDPVLGNPDGDITIVEFFDYNCGFCRRAHSDMVALLDSDPNVRFVIKEFPILGPDSQQAHTVSLAFQRIMPDRYGEFMDRLITGDGRADEATALALAAEFGVEEAKMRFEMENPDIIASVQETYELANALGITGTPTYVIGNEVLAGAVGSETLAQKMANMRECGQTDC